MNFWSSDNMLIAEVGEMGNFFDSLFRGLFGKKEMRIPDGWVGCCWQNNYTVQTEARVKLWQPFQPLVTSLYNWLIFC